MSERIIQSVPFKEIIGDDWHEGNHLANFLRELHDETKKLNPFFEIHLRAVHQYESAARVSEIDIEQKVYGQLVLLTDYSFVIHDNPWSGTDYYAHLSDWYDDDDEGWIVPKSSIGVDSQDYLFVSTDEIQAIEVHLPYVANKQIAPVVLERVTD